MNINLCPMKIKCIAFTILMSLILSCSDETNPSSDTSYFPIKTGNYWTYNYSSPTLNEIDSIYVSNDTLIETITYNKFRSLNLPFGFYSNSLNKNSLRISSSKILLTGAVNYSLGNAIPINFDISNFVIFDELAATNKQLDFISGTISQQYESYPLTIEYKLTSTALESLPTFTANSGTIYSDIKKVKTTLNIKITSSIVIAGLPNPVAFTLLNSQDVLTAIHYYSKNIGMVHTQTSLSYQLQDFSQFNISIPLPQSGSEVQQENLSIYIVNN